MKKAGHHGEKLAKTKAGDLEAGSPAPASLNDLPLRAVAGMFLLRQLREKVNRRNAVLKNLHHRSASVDAPAFLRMYQTDVDMILWLMTCAGLVEVDEQAHRIAAVPEHMRDTFNANLKAPSRRK